MSSMNSPDGTSACRAAVIDTNVLLDWLVFEEPSVAPMARALVAGSLRWVATQPMLDEFTDVLSRPEFDRFAARRLPACAVVARLCVVLPTCPTPESKQLHCSDPDDQKFIDLAMTHPVRWLLSRDKALLRLARRARPHGIEVLSPAVWRLPEQA